MYSYFHETLGLSPTAAALLKALIAAFALVNFVALSALFFIWLERKVAGRIQDRLGPTRVGGRFGWLQTVADGLKLLVKEDLIPRDADKILFRMAPYIAFVGAFGAFIALPFGNNIVARNMDVAVFFMLAIMSTEVFGVILAGYGSASKWSLFGGMREAAEMISYEIPLALCVLVPVIVAGTMNLHTIGQMQAGVFWNWLVFHDPFTFCAFWTYFTVATAECKRAPFDLAEAESELVAGFHTEYSGMKFGMFFVGEYLGVTLNAALLTTLFFGGWLGPAFLPPLAWFVLKTSFFILFFILIRGALPRPRYDQLMAFGWKVMLPLTLVNIVVTGGLVLMLQGG